MLHTRDLCARVLAVLCSLACVLSGCSADDSPSGPPRTGTAAQGATAFPFAGSSAAVGPKGRGAAGTGINPNDFGSPNTVLPMADPNAVGGSGCRNATVAFVIDGSGSMCETFGNSTRWTELRKALLDKASGLIYKLDTLASFGLYLYDGTIDFSLAMMASGGTMQSCMSPNTGRRLMGGMCPQIVEVKPAMRNAAKIDQAYPTVELGGSTPTDKAMNHVVDALIAARGPSGKAPDGQFIILATDGEPNDICTGGTGGDGTAQKMGVINAVDRAIAAGIPTFVISLASDPGLQMHLEEVARHGNPNDLMAHAYSPTNSADLTMTLTKLLGSALGCLF